MQNDTRYFHVTGGAVLAAYERFVALRQAQLDARTEERDKWGATGTYANGHGIQGLLYQDTEKQKAGPVPEGWQMLDAHNVWAPSKRTKEGKAIHKAWKDFPLAGAEEFQAEVLGVKDVFYFMDFPRVRQMVYERMGDTLILLVPKIAAPKTDSEDADTGEGHKWQPPDADCVELKTSEYWKLKEDAAVTK